jgi:hypothetical protein
MAGTERIPTLKGLNKTPRFKANYATLSGLEILETLSPRAALRLPWALIFNPFGVKNL